MGLTPIFLLFFSVPAGLRYYYGPLDNSLPTQPCHR